MNASAGFPKQTTELLIALAAIYHATASAREDDGRVSAMEGLKIAIASGPKVIAGLTGLSDVINEIVNVDRETLEAMAREIMPELDGAIDDDVIAVVDMGVSSLASIIDFARAIRDLRNPSPLDVEESAAPLAEQLPE